MNRLARACEWIRLKELERMRTVRLESTSDGDYIWRRRGLEVRVVLDL